MSKASASRSLIFARQGSDGRGISTIVTWYYHSTSATALEGGEWLSECPPWVDGKYIWSKTDVTYTDGTTTTAGPACISGGAGPTGKDGARGAVLRGPQAWDEVSLNYPFYSGGTGEPYVDVVEYKGYYYYCKKTHRRSQDTQPGSTGGDAVWQLGDSIDLVATKILLAEYSVIQNLGVEAIEMKDASGNVVFLAKGGDVQCNTGTFRNVTAEDINVQSGKIAGFNISGNGLVNDGFDNDAYVVFRNDDMKCFAGIGGNVMPTSAGLRAVARFENEASSDFWQMGENIAAIFSAKNAGSNTAIHINGGCVSGFAMKNQIINGTTTTYLTRGVNNIVALGNGNVNVYLPTLDSCDDGYVMRVQSLKDTGSIRLYTQNGTTLQGSVGRSAIICYVDGKYTVVTTGYFDLSAPGYAMELVWWRDLTVTVSGVTYKGVWLQYKMPRDW